MKIPTLLGLLILLLISAVVVFGANFLQRKTPKPSPEVFPIDIAENNLSTDSATITWQTSSPTTTEGWVASDQRGTQIFQNLKDNRDSSTPAAISWVRTQHLSELC